MLNDLDAELEISERVSYWQTQYEEEYLIRRQRGFKESTAREIARMAADASYARRFPEDYK